MSFKKNDKYKIIMETYLLALHPIRILFQFKSEILQTKMISKIKSQLQKILITLQIRIIALVNH